jgi:hypothetical protein
VNALKRVVAAVVWVLIAALVAFGGAGIVAAMNHVPGTAARAELTWTADVAAKAQLDAATERLQDLTTAVEALGTSARQALAAVNAGDVAAVNAAVVSGTTQLATITTAQTALEDAIARIPDVGAGSELRVAAGVEDRYAGLAGTVPLATGLDDDWTVLTGRALDAVNLSALLARHDQETAAAAQQGAKARYKQALAGLEASDATVAQAKTVRDRLAKTADVSVLTSWIDRNAAYDKALRHLYEVLIEADGKVTSKVRAAFDREQAARAQLPGDTRPLVVIMADIAQGGLNQAAISIEEARSELADALAIQRQLQQDVQIALPE